MIGRKTKIILTASLLLAGVALRIHYLNSFSGSPLFDVPRGPDVEEYCEWAREIVAGRWLWDKVHIHSPLYPFFLAMLYRLFSHLSSCFYWVRFSQIMLGFACFVPLTGVIWLCHGAGFAGADAGSSGRRKSAATLCFIALWSWYPPLVYYLGELTSEVVMVPLLSLALYLLYLSERETPLPSFVTGVKPEAMERFGDGARKFWSFNLPGKGNPFHYLAGICSGLACIAHPFALFFVFSEIIYLYLRSNFKALLWFTLASMTMVLPVSFYNIVILGENIPIQANGGFNLYLGNNPEADGTCSLRPGQDWDDFHLGAEYKASELGISKDSLLIQKTAVFIFKNPLQWLGLLGRKALMVWNHRELTAGADLHDLRYYTAFQDFFSWAFGVCAVLALTAIFTNLTNRSFIYGFRHVLILLGTFWIGQTLLVTSGRYRVSMLPCILILAAWLISDLPNLLSAGRRATLQLFAAALAACAIVYAPVAPFDPQRETAEAASLLGEAFLIKNDLDNAEKHLAYAAENLPPWSRSYNLMGMLYEARGDNARAMEHYLDAVRTAPSDPDGFMNIALLFSKKGHYDKAADFFEKAFSLRTSHSAELHYNFAVFRFTQGDMPQAYEHYLKCLDINPGHAMALNNLGILFHSQGQYREAALLFQRSLLMEPGNTRRMLNLAAAQFASGDPDAARATINNVLKIAPSMPEAAQLKSIVDSQ